MIAAVNCLHGNVLGILLLLYESTNTTLIWVLIWNCVRIYAQLIIVTIHLISSIVLETKMFLAYFFQKESIIFAFFGRIGLLIIYVTLTHYLIFTETSKWQASSRLGVWKKKFRWQTQKRDWCFKGAATGMSYVFTWYQYHHLQNPTF